MEAFAANPLPAAAFPLASRMHVSFVEVSESTVTRLKLLSAARFSAVFSACGVRGASVVMTEIIVAMFGMIMPEPFTMPPTVNVLPTNGAQALT